MSEIKPKTAIIIGGGPAGLAAALELLRETDVLPVIFEGSEMVGGISRTVDYKGNKIDIGGHRFFSKSDRVMRWWLEILPLQDGAPTDLTLTYQNKETNLSVQGHANPEKVDKVMLVRDRLSRILFIGKFFKYPISLSYQTVVNLGPWRLIKILFSYLRIKIKPVTPEKSLEDFYINRFGRELYKTFFRDYTEKVWGVPCSALSAEWGAQRVKGLSITSALKDAASKVFRRDQSLTQKGTETSLIEKFLYPKFGPGQMWQEVARQVVEKGGELNYHSEIVGLELEGQNIKAVTIKNNQTGEVKRVEGDYFISTMPVKDLIKALGEKAPPAVKGVAERLTYRDFITAGLLLKKPLPAGKPGTVARDNWLYIQEPGVKVGRIQIFNNWSPYMVQDSTKTWVGLEYFCNEGDDLWQMESADFINLASQELEQIKLIDAGDVLDGTVIKMKKTYPSYHGGYEQFQVIRDFTDGIGNLFLIGRNGMHRYNNQDHSMLTAMMAVDNIKTGYLHKDNLWAVNAEQEYHEEKK